MRRTSSVYADIIICSFAVKAPSLAFPSKATSARVVATSVLPKLDRNIVLPSLPVLYVCMYVCVCVCVTRPKHLGLMTALEGIFVGATYYDSGEPVTIAVAYGRLWSSR